MSWPVLATDEPGTYTVQIGVFSPGWTSELEYNSNAAVRLNGSPAVLGPSISLPSGSQLAALLVTRQAPTQNPALPTTVAFEVRDVCGPWPSFVGGPTAF